MNCQQQQASFNRCGQRPFATAQACLRLQDLPPEHWDYVRVQLHAMVVPAEAGQAQSPYPTRFAAIAGGSTGPSVMVSVAPDGAGKVLLSATVPLAPWGRLEARIAVG